MTRWRSIAAKAVGSSHVQSATPCQDAFAVTETNDGVCAVAVADGAGSAQFSALGANRAVEAAISSLWNEQELDHGDARRWNDAIERAFAAAREDILQLALDEGSEPRQFAATLQVVLLGDSVYGYGRIGDGATVGRAADDVFAIAPRPENVFVNETHFLTTEDVRPLIIFGERRISECAVFTDGLQHLALQLAEWAPHRKFFSPLFDFARTNEDVSSATEQLEAYLRSDRIDTRTDDDRTLVIAVRNGDGQ